MSFPYRFSMSTRVARLSGWRGFTALALLVFALDALAALPAGVTQGPSVEGVTQYMLANGLRVLLFPDASQPKTTVNMTYLVGSRMENYGETGMAHLLEHMLFKGTPTSGNLMSALSQRGMNFNGTTFFDRTNYFETFPASQDNLDWALSMEADRMVNSKIARADLDTEMTVVRNEMENGENNPTRILIQRTQAAGFDWHNYGKDTIGARTDVELVDIGRLQAFYRMYYQPDNAVLVIAGAFDVDKTLAAVAKYFGPIPRPTRTLPRLYTVEPVQDGERQVVLRRVGSTQWLSAMYHTTSAASADSVPIEAVVDLMSVAPGGRLYKALVEGKKAASVSDFDYMGYDPSFAMFLVQVPEQDSLAVARDALLATVEGVKSQPVSAPELERVRAKNLKYIEETLNDPQRFGVALSTSIAQGDWRLFFLRRDRWRTVTPADVDRVAVAYFKPSNRTLGEFIPDAKPDRAPAPQPVDIAALVKDYKGDAAVAAGETFDPTPANLDARAQRFTLANGMKLVLLPKSTRGATVHFALRMHYGDTASVMGKEGDAMLTAGMLMRGTATRSRQDIEDTLDRLRSTLAIDGGQTSVSATGQTVRASVAPTLDLLADVLQHPSFPASELETLKRARIAAVDQQRTDPGPIAQRTLGRYENPYPKGDDRYTPTFEEEVAELRSPDLASLRAFHQAFYGTTAAEIAVVGDFDPSEVKPQLERLFGAWKAAQPFARVPQPLVVKRPTAVSIETPDKANGYFTSQLAFALDDRDPDYPAMMLANYVLGGSGNSRLWNRIRQKEGLSYGIGSSLRASSFEPSSAMTVNAIFAPENLEKLRGGIRDELARATGEGFSEQEIAEGKRALLEQRKLARSQDPGLAQGLVEQAYVGRTFAYSAQVDAAIAALTPAQVNAALRKYVRPEAFASFYAGDFAKKQ